MTPKEKQLLLKDLCARLPYGVKINHQGYIQELTVIVLEDIIYSGHEVKPYLRPMGSMTEEEKIEWDAEYAYNSHTYPYEEYLARMLDWLNKKMFDYRGLIPMGLAIEAPEGMYNNKN